MISSIRRLDETTISIKGSGDNWHMTWACDDRQYVGLCDGRGFPHIPCTSSWCYNTKLYAIRGCPPDFEFEDVPGYPALEATGPTPECSANYSRYYGFGILALDGFIYQYLSTPRYPFGASENAFIGAKLIYSPDMGKTWLNQDGSPLRWELWEERRKENMVFFEEPDGTFSLLTILQMGRNYEHNKDGYVYVYSPDGYEDGKMNRLVMFRVPKDRILNRNAYEYFVSRTEDGDAVWSPDINDRGAVCTFPEGWVNRSIGNPYGCHPYAWQPSVVYNAPLGLYMMANWGMGVGDDGDWFGKPSYLGFWTAPNPWGPWSQVYEEVEWKPLNDKEARAYQPQISPKWIAEDGRSFWLIWTDFRPVGNERPFYTFNCQKVEIIMDCITD